MIGPVLDNIRILLCRPDSSSNEMAKALSAVGAECNSLPTLDIVPISISESDKQKIINLDQYQHIIVVSQHAASYGIDKIDEYWPQFPSNQNWFAIGRKTAEILNSNNLNLISTKQDMDSETLLQHSLLKQIDRQKILILKGHKGRDHLQDSLEEKGAFVDKLELYERQCPDYSSDHLHNQIQKFDPQYVIALSGETLENLISLSKKANISIKQYSFILSSQRVANIASKNGLKFTFVPENLMPIDIIKCISAAEKRPH